jgi:hypothetical protein
MNFTDEAKELWNQLSEAEQNNWTENVVCQRCFAEIQKEGFNASVYEESLALFHLCKCGNKEVRLIDVSMQNQKAIDDDFEAWKNAKLKAREEQSKDQ